MKPKVIHFVLGLIMGISLVGREALAQTWGFALTDGDYQVSIQDPRTGEVSETLVHLQQDAEMMVGELEGVAATEFRALEEIPDLGISAEVQSSVASLVRPGSLGVMSSTSIRYDLETPFTFTDSAGNPLRGPAFGLTATIADARYGELLILDGPDSGGNRIPVTAHLVLEGSFFVSHPNPGYGSAYYFDLFGSFFDQEIEFRWDDSFGSGGLYLPIDITAHVPPNTFYSLELQLMAHSYVHLDGGEWGLIGLTEVTIDFLSTLSLNSENPFTIPEGYTLTSTYGTPTTGTSGVPDAASTIGLLLVGFGCLLGFRKAGVPIKK